jgi:hypothetical protein
MSYRTDVSIFDLAGVFGGAIPVLSGTLTSTIPGTSLSLGPDPSVAIPGASSTSVLFSAAASGVFPGSVVLSDAAAPTGQLFRSGEIALPPSPGQLTVITAVGEISPTDLAAFGSSLSGSQLSTPVADWAKVLLGLFTFGPPESVTITSATITPGAGSLSVVVTGSVTYQLLFFIPFTQTFTISTTVAITPSGDAERTDRIVSVVPTATTLTLPPQTVGFNVFNGKLAALLEPMINQAIADAVDTTLRASTPSMQRTPTCVISARRVAITTGGLSAQLMLADFGPVVAARPGALALSVTPTPAPKIEAQYTFRVIDRSDGSAVPQATVALTNYNPTTTETQPVNMQGEAMFTTRLSAKTLAVSGHQSGGPRVLEPYAVATAPGAQTATLVLTLDDS